LIQKLKMDKWAKKTILRRLRDKMLKEKQKMMSKRNEL